MTVGSEGCEEEQSFWKLYIQLVLGFEFSFLCLFSKFVLLHCIVHETIKLLKY